SAIHFQFPDPWWKRAHFKRSVLQPEFAKMLLTKMVPGGLFDLRTDVKDRAERMLATLESAGWVNPLGHGSFHLYDPQEVPSSRGRRYLVSAEQVYRARLRAPAGRLAEKASQPPRSGARLSHSLGSRVPDGRHCSST